MKEKSTGKSLKAQLFSAVAMMLVATIALGSATFAWFVNNRTATVANMDLTVSSASSLQIAVKKVGGTTYTEYKNLIANADITSVNADASAYANGAGWTKMFVTALAPTTASNGNVKTDAFFLSTGAMANNKLTTFKAVTRATGAEAGGDPVKKIPLSFLSSKDTNVYFGSQTFTTLAHMITAKQSIKTGADQTAEQAIFDQQRLDVMKALRVAIVPNDNATTPAASTPLIFQFDDAANHVNGAAYNTDFTKVTMVNGSTVDVPAAITALQSETTGSYAAVSAVSAVEDDTKGFATAVETQRAFLPTGTGNAPDYFATVTTGTDGGPDTTAPGTTPLFDLKAGVAKDVVVYIWLEGTDMDCVSVLSDYPFSVNLAFASADPVVVP